MHRLSFTEFSAAVALLLWSLSFDFVTSIRDVRIDMPHALKRGEKAFLKCLYNLDEDDILYSVKWYRGRREFFSFTPKETPAMKVYPVPGIKVERSLSNESQLVLDNVNMATTGKYSCEVSADAPSFHTLIASGDLEVVEVPGKDPIITGIRSRYRVGDIVRGNCTVRHTKPAANLTWTINGRETNPSHIRHHKPSKDAREMETALSGIHFVVTPQHFMYGKLKIRCTASIHDVYWKSTEKSIEEERHRHSLGNNVVSSFSDDYFDVDDINQLDRSDTYMTHVKGDASLLNSAAASVKHHTKANLLTGLITLTLLLHGVQQILQLWRQLLVKIKTAIAKGITRKMRFEQKRNIKITATKTKATTATVTATLTAIKALSSQGDHCNTPNGEKVASIGTTKGHPRVCGNMKWMNSNTKEAKVQENAAEQSQLTKSNRTKAIQIAESYKKTYFLLIKRKSEKLLLQGQLAEIVLQKGKQSEKQQHQRQQWQPNIKTTNATRRTRTTMAITRQRAIRT